VMRLCATGRGGIIINFGFRAQIKSLSDIF
jgi:hypothetical protein